MTRSPFRPATTAEHPLPLRLVPSPAPGDVDALIEEAQLAEQQGRRDVARKLYEQALHKLGPSDAGTAAALMRWIGLTYQSDTNVDAALDCFEASLAVAEACGDVVGAGHATNAMATAHLRLGQLEPAEALFLQAREQARRSGQAKLAAMTAQNLGIIANVRGELEQALWHYEASLADYRALGLPKYICMTLNNLGMLYTRMERWDTAERAYDEAVQISQILGDVATRMLLEVNRATLWIARRDFGRAREACDLAMELSRQTHDTHGLGEVYKCYGIIARERGDLTLATESFERAHRLAEDQQDLLLAAETSREMAELFRRQGRNRDTLQCLNRAHRLFSQLHARRDLADIDRQMSHLESDFVEVVRRWGESIESKDHYTQGHCERVADLSCALYLEAGLDPQALFWFRVGALLHDVGKLIIPPEVLNKPGRLTTEEWALVKQHPLAGVQMLADIDFPWDVRPIVESHHERWDGAGYPHGLRGEAIPLVARILCVADVYDALTSERSYKKPVSHAQALDMMRAEIGGQFDPQLFRHFEALMSRSRSSLEVPAAEDAQPGMPGDATAARVSGAATSAGGADAGSDEALAAPAPELDHLTGALLRRSFAAAAESVLSRRRAQEQTASLLVIDVDHFKLVNDTYGHLQGDDVLRAVVEVLRATLRSNDVIGRYGGDEFVVMLPRTSSENAVDVAERLRHRAEELRVPLREQESGFVGVTLSIGVAAAQPSDHIEALFAAADRALYESKRGGRNAVTLASASAEGGRPQLALNRFVGRVDEMKRLVRLLEGSQAGQPQVVAIVGEAGVGKSTLLRQLLPEVRLRNGALVLGRCLEADVKPPYGPWAEVLGAIRSQVAFSDRTWRELPRLVPSLGDGSPLPTESAGSKYALYDEIVEYLRRAAATCPLVIVLDDMQWADSATWDTLEHLVAQLETDRILICLTVRAEDAGGDVTERRRRLSRDERFYELALPRLTREELEQWLAAASHGQELGRELLPLLYRHTEGNPFLVVQVLRNLIEEGEIRYEGNRWTWRHTSELRLPVAVSDLMARRLDRLSPKTRSILTTAAVIGRVFDLDVAIGAGAGSENELLDAVDEAIAAAVLEPSRNDSDRFSFAHTLLVEAIRSTANPRRLRRIHEAVARSMVASADPSAAGQIALHFDQAGAGAEAYHWATLAGQRARGVYAHDEAAAFYQMAQRNASTPLQRLDSALALASVAEASSRYQDALALCEEALKIAEGVAPEKRLTIRRTRERLHALLGAPVRDTLEAYEALLEEATAVDNVRERVALLSLLGELHAGLGDLAAAERLAREGVARAEGVGDDRLLADALTRLGLALSRTGQHEALACFERANTLFTQREDLFGMARCQNNIGVFHTLAANHEEGERAFARGVELARGAHAPEQVGAGSMNLGVLYLKGGRFQEAHTNFEEAHRLFRIIGNEHKRLAALYNLAHLAREQGEARRALTLYGEAATLAQRVGQSDVEIGARAGVGVAALVLGDATQASDMLATVSLMIGERTDWWFQSRELVEMLNVRVALAEGDVKLAGERFTEGLALAERRDAYAAALLVVELARPLGDASWDEIWPVVQRYAEKVDELRSPVLSMRFADFRNDPEIARRAKLN